MHTGVKKLGKIGEGMVGFLLPTNWILRFWFQTTVQSFIKIERELRSYEGRQTGVTDAVEFIICPMLSYSNHVYYIMPTRVGLG